MVLVRVFAIMGLNGCAIMVTNLLSAVWRALSWTWTTQRTNQTKQNKTKRNVRTHRAALFT